jgi:hypothetical protein
MKLFFALILSALLTAGSVMAAESEALLSQSPLKPNLLPRTYLICKATISTQK